MKLIITILSLSLMTGIVACNSKSDNGGPKAPGYYPNNYVGTGNAGNNIYMPGMPDFGQNQQGSTISLPGCSTPPPMFIDIFQECSWLAVTTDCDREAVDQLFIKKCYGLNLNRPGCEFPTQPVVAACGSACTPHTQTFRRERVRDVRVREPRQRRERVSESRPKIEKQTPVRDQKPVVIREARPKTQTTTTTSQATREVVVHPTPSSSRVVIADRMTGPDNSIGVPKECKGNVARECQYKRAPDRSVKGLRGYKILEHHLTVPQGTSIADSFFYKEAQKGNVKCKHQATSNKFVDYFDYVKAIDSLCFGGSQSQEEVATVDEESAVVETPVYEEATTSGLGEDQVAAQAEELFDSSQCQWIVDLHKQLESGKGYGSYGFQFTTNPGSNLYQMNDKGLAHDLCTIGHSSFKAVDFNGNLNSKVSAIGVDVRIEGNQLFAHPDLGETITRCLVHEDGLNRTIFTEAEFNGHKVTRSYKWNGLKDDNGRVDVHSDFSVLRDGEMFNYSTHKPIVWKKGALALDEVRNDSRITEFLKIQPGTAGYNTSELSKKSNVRDENRKSVCSGIPVIPN